jgi:hypothetical protein
LLSAGNPASVRDCVRNCTRGAATARPPPWSASPRSANQAGIS